MKIDLNSEDHPDDELLEDARMAADSDWAEGFVADLLNKRKRWGRQFALSPKQREKLEQIRDGETR